MATKSKRPLLSCHEKIEAIKRVHEGESKASVARDIGVPESTLRGWCKNEEKILFLIQQSVTPENKVDPEMKKLKYDYPSSGMPASTVSSPISMQYSSPNNTEDSTQDNAPNYDPQFNLLAPANQVRNVDKQRKRNELDRIGIEMGINRTENNIFEHLNVNVPQQGLFSGNTNPNLNHMSGGSTLSNYGNQFFSQNWNQNAFAVAALAKNGFKPTTSKKQDPPILNLSQRDTIKPEDTGNAYLWLKAQQDLINMAQQKVSPNGSPFFNTTDATRNAMLIKWYQQNYHHLMNTQIKSEPENNILLQQLTRGGPSASPPNPESSLQLASPRVASPRAVTSPVLFPSPRLASPMNVPQASPIQIIPAQTSPIQLSTKPEKSLPVVSPNKSVKLRSVLDNIVANNNNNVIKSGQEVKENAPVNKLESHIALDHGKIFLNWLEKCSDPAVSSKQVNDFRFLIENLHKSVERQYLKARNLLPATRANRRKPMYSRQILNQQNGSP